MIETLTDNERRYFAQHMPGDVRSKALRCIDQRDVALAQERSDRAALVEQAALLKRERDEARAEVAAFEANLEDQDALKVQLAADNALLERMRHSPTIPMPWRVTIRDHLSDQPAAPDPCKERHHDGYLQRGLECPGCPAAPDPRDAEIAQLNEALATLQTEHDAHNAAATQYEADIARMKRIIELDEQAEAMLKSEVARLKEALAAAEAHDARATLELEAAEQKLADADALLEYSRSGVGPWRSDEEYHQTRDAHLDRQR